MTPEATEARSITIEYPGTFHRAIGKNRGGTSYWQTREETRNLREVGYVLIRKALPVTLGGARWIDDSPLFAKATIQVTQYWCSKPMDVSGLASASAPLVDAFMDTDVISDDGPETVVETRYAHVRVRHKPEAKIVVMCTEVLG